MHIYSWTIFHAQFALEQEKDKAKTKEYAEEAKKLATCDGPPYYYKVAYEEAERLLGSVCKLILCHPER